MGRPRLAGLVAGHLDAACAALRSGAESLRTLGALVTLEPFAGLDADALRTLASVVDANRVGLELMQQRTRRLFPSDGERTL